MLEHSMINWRFSNSSPDLLTLSKRGVLSSRYCFHHTRSRLEILNNNLIFRSWIQPCLRLLQVEKWDQKRYQHPWWPIFVNYWNKLGLSDLWWFCPSIAWRFPSFWPRPENEREFLLRSEIAKDPLGQKLAKINVALIYINM